MKRLISHQNGQLPQGALYQLWYKTELTKGTPVEINGPHDKYGYVVCTQRKETDGRFLLLIRGTHGTKLGGGGCSLPSL